MQAATHLFVWTPKKKPTRALGEYRLSFVGACTKNIHIDINSQFCLCWWANKCNWASTCTKQQQAHLISLLFFFFKKFRFVGKGYKIRKIQKKKSLRLFFGYSHKVFFFGGGCRLQKLTKYKLFLITNNKKKLNKLTTILREVRAPNLFTKRGLRAQRQRITKRPGKKSTY